MSEKNRFLSGEEINPEPINTDISVIELVDKHFNAYNGARLQEICKLLANKILKEGVTVGMSLSGALTPAGLGRSCIIPMIEAGFIDWIASTGANLYHDAHHALGLMLHKGSPFVDDVELKKNKVVRIYDILMDYDVLLSTDKFLTKIFNEDEFQREMGTAELHYLIGKYLREREKLCNMPPSSILSTAYEYEVPVYTPSPADSSIGLAIAEEYLDKVKLKLNVWDDINETAAIVLDIKRNNGKSAAVIIGGGAPKNFILQTEPQIQQFLGLEEQGHDYFVQITDARADTGGLSGATPSEAVSWGKIDSDMLPNAVVSYIDFSVALPIITSYVMSKAEKRKHKRLYNKRSDFVKRLQSEFLEKRRRKEV
ncbi:MAG: deoxyhypusine synthase [Candidatus Schekmanbacteria bacterium]|nr:MAG: deoxyhypusine synthase [Candidatus Schekmanbacteria bacterium]